MGGLIGAAIGAESAVGGEECIETIDNVTFVAPTADGHDKVVEGPLHIVGPREGGAPHPEDAVPFEIGNQRAGPDLEDVFGGEGNTHDGEPPAPSVDGHPYLVSD